MAPVFDVTQVAETASTKEMRHGTENVIIGWRKQRTICWMRTWFNRVETFESFHRLVGVCGRDVVWLAFQPTRRALMGRVC